MDTARPLRLYQRRFQAYVDSFRGNDEFVDTNIDIKEKHTRRVCLHALALTRSLESSRSEREQAFLAALFHDIGRFPQIQRYATFNDRVSEDHALLGVREIKAAGLLEGLPETTRRRVLTAVMVHNRLKLPSGLDPAQLRLVRILRDADKMDILDVLIQYYQSRNNGDNPALDLDLPRGENLSEAALMDIEAARCVAMQNVASVQDFRLLQTSWVFDINSAWAMNRLRRLGQIDWLLNRLPPGDRSSRAIRSIKTYMDAFEPVLENSS